MFPDADDLPAFLFQRGCFAFIPFGVAIYLSFPKSHVAFGHLAVFRAPVPEAAVHENGDALSREGDVYPVLAVLEPVAMPYFPEGFAHHQFGSGVPAPDFGHYFASFPLRDGIGHSSTGMSGILPYAGIKTHDLIFMAGSFQPTGLEVNV